MAAMTDGDHDDIIAETNRILDRMSSGEPFRFEELLRPTPKSYRIARGMIGDWQRRGWIASTPNNFPPVWTLTDKGRSALEAEKDKGQN